MYGYKLMIGSQNWDSQIIILSDARKILGDLEKGPIMNSIILFTKMPFMTTLKQKNLSYISRTRLKTIITCKNTSITPEGKTTL